VETLRLAVHGTSGHQAAAARLAEQFTRDVLEQLSQALEARAPGRVVLIRRMAVRWSLSEAEMADPENAVSCAVSLADGIASGGSDASHATDTVVTFDDEAGWLAAYLRGRAAGAAGAWYHATWREAERPKAAGDSPLRREMVLVALSRLRATGELAAILAGLPPVTISALASALEFDGAPLPGTAETADAQGEFTPRGASADAAPDDELSTGLRNTDGKLDPRTRQATALDDGPVEAPAPESVDNRNGQPTNEPYAAAVVPPHADMTPSAAASLDALSTDARAAPVAATAAEPIDDAPTGDAADGSAPAGMPSPPLSSQNAAVAQQHAELVAAVAAAMQRTGGAPHQHLAPAPADLPSPVGQTGPRTRFGGLFYLVSLALELGIGESLWKACLPEGLILAHAAAALLGPDASGDPAPAAFGGVAMDDLRTHPPVSPEQQAEVGIELLAATAAALPRHDGAPAPEAVLDLATSPAGRMLVASGLGPFALFAWPAPDARATAAGVSAFLRVWPGSFPPPQAREVLLGLDSSGRLRAAPAPMLRAAALLPAAPTAAAAALLAQVCGAMAELFVVRAGDTPVTAEAVARYLAIPGHVALAPEALTVVLPMAGIDVAVRRAALDRDPGWVPWLRRTVRIEFVSPRGEDVV
jgi:hypothetical protein